MACDHKFLEYLNLQNIQFQPKTLIVGTFNPSWEILNNYAPWFYGRTDNNYFWDILPSIYGLTGMRNASSSEWKEFCSTNKIALTDLISSINDADITNENHLDLLKGYEDSKIATYFNNFTTTDVVKILHQHPSIQQVFFTRQGDNGGFWDNKWQPIAAYCITKNIKNRMLMTPSKNARFKMVKGSGLSLRDFIAEDWLGKWHS